MISIKDKIIERVNDIQDPQLLEELLHAIELEYEIKNFHALTHEEKVAMDEGIENADSGNMFSNLEAIQLVKKRVGK